MGWWGSAYGQASAGVPREGNHGRILTALLVFNTYLLEKPVCPEIIHLMSCGELVVEPAVGSHTGSVSWCAASYGVTDPGLLPPPLFYPLVQHKFQKFSSFSS